MASVNIEDALLSPSLKHLSNVRTSFPFYIVTIFLHCSIAFKRLKRNTIIFSARELKYLFFPQVHHSFNCSTVSWTTFISALRPLLTRNADARSFTNIWHLLHHDMSSTFCRWTLRSSLLVLPLSSQFSTPSLYHSPHFFNILLNNRPVIQILFPSIIVSWNYTYQTVFASVFSTRYRSKNYSSDQRFYILWVW